MVRNVEFRAKPNEMDVRFDQSFPYADATAGISKGGDVHAPGAIVSDRIRMVVARPIEQTRPAPIYQKETPSHAWRASNVLQRSAYKQRL